MVVHISTIDEVRDMLIKLSINERDVHKILSSLQMRENWLQYLSQKIENEPELDHEEIDDNLDDLIRQHSHPSPVVPSPEYATDVMEEKGFLGEPYQPPETVESSASSLHREIHVCDSLGPNPKVMITHMGTRDIDSPLSTLMNDKKADVSTSFVNSKISEIESSATSSVSEEQKRKSIPSSSSSSSSTSSEPTSSLMDQDLFQSENSVASHDELPLVKDLSSNVPPSPKVYKVVDSDTVNKHFCVAVMAENLQHHAFSKSGLVYFSKSCAMRAINQQHS